MATTVVPSHIAVDEAGRAWIAGTRVKVIEVVLDKVAWGWGPDEIHRNYPGLLSLAQIHAAFAYYYDHKAEIDAEIERQKHDFEALKSRTAHSPLRQRLQTKG
jgi:uncharacterized protein (DUF433 family)